MAKRNWQSILPPHPDRDRADLVDEEPGLDRDRVIRFGGQARHRSPDNLAIPIQKMIAQMDRDLAVSEVLTMEQFLGDSTINSLSAREARDNFVRICTCLYEY